MVGSRRCCSGHGDRAGGRRRPRSGQLVVPGHAGRPCGIQPVRPASAGLICSPGAGPVALRVRGVVTGQVFELPVQYAAADDSVVILPGRPEAKRWWRNLAGPAPVDVLLQGRWQHGEGLVLRPGDPGYDTAVGAYRHRWPRVRMPGDSPLVHVRLLADPPAGPSSSADSFSVLVPAAAQTPPTDSAAPGSRVRC